EQSQVYAPDIAFTDPEPAVEQLCRWMTLKSKAPLLPFILYKSSRVPLLSHLGPTSKASQTTTIGLSKLRAFALLQLYLPYLLPRLQHHQSAIQTILYEPSYPQKTLYHSAKAGPEIMAM